MTRHPTAPVSMTVPQLRRHQCTVGGRTVRLRRAQAHLLALLLVGDPDKFLGMAAIVEALWPDPDRQPDTAPKVVGVYLSQLRAHGIAIDSKFRCGRGVGRFNGWRIPRGGRAADAAPACERLAA